MMGKSLIKFFLVLSVTFLLPVSAAKGVQQQSCLRIGVFNVLLFNKVVMATAKRIFEDADLCVDLIPLPPVRAEKMDLEGDLDGELQRTMVWAEMHADKIIAVPTPLFIDRMMALSLEGRQLDLSSLEDLKGRQVLIPGEHRWLAAKMAEIDVNPVLASRIPRYMELLRSGQADVGLMDSGLLEALGNLSGIKVQEVARVEYHMMLQRNHKGIVDRLDAAIRAVKSEQAATSSES